MSQKIFLSVTGIRVDDDSNSPILLLGSEDQTRILPIWVGSIEAVNIAYAKDNIITSRPLTHELLINIIESLDGKVSELCIDDMIENTFHAHLIIQTSNGDISVPCRPSDGVSIAIRSDAPISVYKEIFDTISVELIEDSALEEFDKFIETVNPSDFV